MLAANQLGVIFTPLLGQLAAKRLGENGLGEVVHSRQGLIDLLLDTIGMGEELIHAADDFGLLFRRRYANSNRCNFFRGCMLN